MKVKVIGAGLAGCEAAWQLARHGIETELYEMKPGRFSPAHRLPSLAELVCSNSLKAMRVSSACGLLKEEMARLGSLTVPAAYQCQVPAGGALAVNREDFSRAVTKKIEENPLIHVIREEVTRIPEGGVRIIATGPLTADPLAEKISALCGGALSFFDAAAPVVAAESLDMDHIFRASRYDKGGDDAYLNCPLNREEYETFHRELVHAQCAPIHGFDREGRKVYEGCMPVEVLAARGIDSLRYGPMKPVGLRDPATGHRPWAVVQLRAENREGTLYNLVGFQTNLKFGEQKRVFGLIPGLRNAEYMRYGVMHRNTFINSPRLLQPDFSMRQDPSLYFAGQITGVEGYMESAASGLLAGLSAACKLLGKRFDPLPQETMLGALAHYVSGSETDNFQPMGANFGILPPLDVPVRQKQQRYQALADRALHLLDGEIRRRKIL